MLQQSPEKIERLHTAAPILEAAISTLSEVPGFANKLHIVLSTLHLPTNGEFYEIEKALRIGQKNSYNAERIEHMNPIIRLPQDPEPTYFDLLTTHRFIECKHINWNENPKENSPLTTKLHTQFLRQQKKVFLINQNCNTSFAYEMHSKRKIPEKWHEWFRAQGISVVEDKN